MLELRPNCEWCDQDLPPASTDAWICSYECTYCSRCVAEILNNVCPTCGGGLTPRPIRPRAAYREQLTLGLENNPPIAIRTHSRWTRDQVDQLTAQLRNVPPADR